LFQLKKNLIVDVKQNLKDKCANAFEEEKLVFILRFISQFDSDLLVKLFPTLPLLE